MAYDNLPPGTRDSDRDAPWNAEDFDGADDAHGIEQVTGGDGESTAETFAEFVAAHMNDSAQPLLAGDNPKLSAKASNDELLRIILSSPHQVTVFAAARELRARYLASPYTQHVVSCHADDWRASRREAMLEGEL